jgi:hypothetical protein
VSRRPPLQPEEVTPLGMSRIAPGGRLWSESPVRRPYPRVRQMGSAKTNPCGPDYPRTALTSTRATFEVGAGSASVSRTWLVNCNYMSSVDCMVRVLSLDASGGTMPTMPSGWIPAPAAPDGAWVGLDIFEELAGSIDVAGWVIEWDDSGAMTGICSILDN